jgi:hypothetical protein
MPEDSPVRFLVAIAAWLALLLFTLTIYAAEPEVDNGDIVGLHMAGPAMAKGTPAMWFGVKSCSIYVLFLVMDDGHMWQIDESHHPVDMEAFMKSIAGLRHQLKVIPCTATL